MWFEQSRKVRFRYGFVAMLSSAMLLTACLEEIGDLDKVGEVRITPEVATPVANSVFGISDFLESIDSEGFIETGDDGLVTLIYGEELSSESAEDLFNIQDQFFTEILQAPGEFIVPLPFTGSIPIEAGFTESFVPDNEERFDSLSLKSGNLSVSLSSGFNASGDITMTIPSLQRNGEALSLRFNWTYNGSTPIVTSEEVDISGYSLILTDGSGVFNQFGYSLSGSLTFDNEFVEITDQLNLEIRLSNTSFRGVFGYLGQRRIAAESDTLRIDLFENITAGTLLVEDPQIRFIFDNSFGIPAAIDFQDFSARSNADVDVQLEGSIIDDLQNINSPGINQVGQSVVSTISIDNENSNISEVLSILPERITYGLDGLVGGTDVNVRSFALDTSRIKVSYEVEIPLNFQLEGLFVSNIYDFNGEDFNDVITLTFLIDTENGFPFELSLQAYFIDAQGVVLDSLFTPETSNILEAAQVDGQGFVSAPSLSSITIPLSEARANNLIEARQLQIDARVETSGNISVKILEEYLIDLKIGVTSELDLSTASGD